MGRGGGSLGKVPTEMEVAAQRPQDERRGAHGEGGKAVAPHRSRNMTFFIHASSRSVGRTAHTSTLLMPPHRLLNEAHGVEERPR